ncbi:MAG: 30S ribosomal protein S6 [Candidatus Omnitrophica bacterium]|jgi:ribosomal protein S6|nr:30S ribosomal protein S6 [Candidatus Omnitrophota bacterium]
MNNYEGVFITRATLDKEAQDKLVEDIKGVITKNKGEIVQLQSWGKKKLTFLIKKQPEGVYYFTDFQLPPLALKKAETTYRLNDDILRFLIIRKTA